MDFSIDDTVVLEPDVVRSPTLIDRVPAPRIRAYPRVVAVAEKVQAMVALGRRNSHMKDFHDVGSLSEALASIRHGAEGGARRMRVIRSGKSSNHALHASAWSSVRQRSPGCLEGSRHVIHHFAELLVQPYGAAAVNPGDDVGATPRNQVFPKSDENG